MAAILAAQSDPVENWDDDIDFEGDLFSSSVSTAVTSSHMSVKSESNAPTDEDWHVHIAISEHSSTSHAISSLKQVGIQIPENISSSALLGAGSIKRLGKKNSRQKVTEDWDGDLVFPSSDSFPKLRSLLSTTDINSSWPDSVDGTGDGFGDDSWANPPKLRAPPSSMAPLNRSKSPSTGVVAESEDEMDGLDGLELPKESIDFLSMLNNRRQAVTSSNEPSFGDFALNQDIFTSKPDRKKEVDLDDDFLDGLSLGPDDLVDVQKQVTMNNNVKIQKPKVPIQPARKPTTVITFSDKPTSSRIPRPSIHTLPSKQNQLPTVVEASSFRYPGIHRLPPPPPIPQSSSRHQLLRTKRSAPLLRGSSSRHVSAANPVPPLTQQLSSMRNPTHVRRESDPHRASSPTNSRPMSRQGGGVRVQPGTPSRTSRDIHAVRQTFSRPTRNGNFGDGSELDDFDDLPTSTAKEGKYVKPQPLRHQPSKLLRAQPSRSGLNRVADIDCCRTNTAASPNVPALPNIPSMDSLYNRPNGRPLGPIDSTHIPSFARDTAASRIAREQRIATSKAKADTFHVPSGTNWRATVAFRDSTMQTRKRTNTSSKPFLIKGVGSGAVRNEKGMTYNPQLQRWEGNETELQQFENSPSNSAVHFNSLPYRALRPSASSRDVSGRYRSLNHPMQKLSLANLASAGTAAGAAVGPTSRPALISPLHYGSGRQPKPQYMGGRPKSGNDMVWDPQSMKWVNEAGIEEDPFMGIDDLIDDRADQRMMMMMGHSGPIGLSDNDVRASRAHPVSSLPAHILSAISNGNGAPSGPPPSFARVVPDVRSGGGAGSRGLGFVPTGRNYAPQLEEFDPGPEFINRQRQEESYCMYITHHWTGALEEELRSAIDGKRVLSDERHRRAWLLR